MRLDSRHWRRLTSTVVRRPHIAPFRSRQAGKLTGASNGGLVREGTGATATGSYEADPLLGIEPFETPGLFRQLTVMPFTPEPTFFFFLFTT